jgi:hypothetical protein
MYNYYATNTTKKRGGGKRIFSSFVGSKTKKTIKTYIILHFFFLLTLLLLLLRSCLCVRFLFCFVYHTGIYAFINNNKKIDNLLSNISSSYHNIATTTHITMHLLIYIRRIKEREIIENMPHFLFHCFFFLNKILCAMSERASVLRLI